MMCSEALKMHQIIVSMILKVDKKEGNFFNLFLKFQL